MGGKQRYWGANGKTSSSESAANTKLLKNRKTDHRYDYNDHLKDETATTSAGCMCAVFQIFDFHPLNQHHQSHSSTSNFKPIVALPSHDQISSPGTEAPRNSLESDEEDDLRIPMGIAGIKTRRKTGIESSSSDYDCFSGNSPSTKTPTLVARLMGLDLLPQTNNSPTSTRRTTSTSGYPLLKQNDRLILAAPRSLPETPRTSCENRKSNLENYHHRLSLQIPSYDNKENRNQNPSPSPSHYAKEIVKQIKESVSRKAGVDITNYTRRSDDQLIIQTKPKRSSSPSSATSPKLRVLEPKNMNKQSSKIETGKASGKPKQNQKQKTKAKPNTNTKPPLLQSSTDIGEQRKSKKEINEKFGRFSSKIAKATNDSHLKKIKKTPLSNDILNFSTVPTVLMKKEPASISSAVVPRTQKSLCNGNQPTESQDEESKLHHQHCKTTYEDVIQFQPKTEHNKKHHIKPTATTTTTAAITESGRDCGDYNNDMAAELEYVRKILSRTSSTPVYSIVVDNNNEVSIRHQSDRKLFAHLADELLKPYVELQAWSRRRTVVDPLQRWPELVEKLCDHVRSYPRAKCQVLEDIDGIIEKDLDRNGIQVVSDEEGEDIVKAIEKGIVEELLSETVGLVVV